MKTLGLLFCSALITSCTAMYSTDPDSMYFDIPEGSTLSLNKALSISNIDTHGVIQNGTQVNDDNKKDYDINCRLDFKKFGPRTIEPEKFTVTRTEDGSNWVSRPSILRFYTEVHLSSSKDTDIIEMVCQVYGDHIDRNFTVAEMQAALGDFITFTYLSNKAE